MIKIKPTNRVVNFKCELDCGGQCCTALTMVLPAEVKNVYEKAPLTLTMHANSAKGVLLSPNLRKEAPRFMPKVTMNEDDGTYIGELCVFFDFAMGAWHSEKPCFLLKDGLCSIHNNNKPLKCKLLPIQPLTNETVMFAVYEKMRSYCPGVKSMTAKDCCVFKNGKLCNKEDLKNLQAYYDMASTTLDFSCQYFKALCELNDGSIIEQLREEYQDFIEKKGNDLEFFISMEVPFFPSDIFLKHLEISKDDYIEKQLAVIEKFKEYDPEGFNKSFLSHQYMILKAAKEAEA